MNPIRKAAIGGILTAVALGGGALGAALINGSASAQTSTTTAPADTSATTAAVATPAPSTDAPDTDAPDRDARGTRDPSTGGHVANGITETVLTGDTAAKVTAAAQAAVPDATIERVENDAEGAVYEAHMEKADGSHVTVKLDADFNVTSTESGRK